MTHSRIRGWESHENRTYLRNTPRYTHIEAGPEVIAYSNLITMDPNSSETKSLYPDQPVRVIVPERAEDIYTQRLYLRPLELADAGDLFEYRSRQDVADWL